MGSDNRMNSPSAICIVSEPHPPFKNHAPSLAGITLSTPVAGNSVELIENDFGLMLRVPMSARDPIDTVVVLETR